jgi:hypothetical protein
VSLKDCPPVVLDLYIGQESCDHRDKYLEQQKTEKIETEVRDVDRILIIKVYTCCPGLPSGGS